ncbi:hypothetical protein NEF87_002882 [Candidatus Lokiarchaeum ossiferum]|uniref:Radical SAM core domain-containing protein n=1 Tax=Candidatus Lokiarchaeum ossiferum TaxID=2951803 RepID=A0ABY6HW57_9ARCH|nr:hypothetical protein NEF87_002882 [Candidatus Lokiarchaeum sp. B-35]
MKLLIIDGYIDTPGCLGVPPYLSPLARYIFGSVKKNLPVNSQINYVTIDQFRKSQEKKTQQERFETNQGESIQNFISGIYDITIFITGVSVPGKYLTSQPIRFSELRRYGHLLTNSFTILCGPATKYGIGEEGGKTSISAEKLKEIFNLIIYGDPEIVLNKLLSGEFLSTFQLPENIEEISRFERKSMEEIRDFAIEGAKLIPSHPNYSEGNGGNLICEIETFRGCPRYHSGGCAFCIEPLKGKTLHRSPDSVIAEIVALYSQGVRHFRLGSQTDFYAFQHKAFDHPKYPRPNPEVIEFLLSSIRNACPDLKTLHIDNVNALNFVLYPDEATQITKAIVKYCTAGNIAAIGVESVDNDVIIKNNLKATAPEILETIKIINLYGSDIGENGSPKFLPGLNFIMGLPGETKTSLDECFEFLSSVIEQNLLLRRINLRKFMVPTSIPQKNARKISKHLTKFASKYYHWKELIREQIDNPMLKKIYPIGRELSNCYAEKHEGNATLLRQPGTYPIICFVHTKLPLKQYYNLLIVNHGQRSITCLQSPVNLIELSQKELESIDGIGKKRAISIKSIQPKTFSEWNENFPEIIDRLLKIQPSIKEVCSK